MSNQGVGRSNEPLINSFTRIWLIDGRARADHDTEFLSYMKVAGLTQGFGSTNAVYLPDKNRLGAFIEAASFKDGAERPTTSLVGRYAAFVKSRMLQLAQKGCEFDIQVHIGECEDPSIFNQFEKILIFENVTLDNYTTEDMGALEPGEQGKIDETGDISMRIMYEYVPLKYSARNPAVVTNQLLDVIIPDRVSCGDCDIESDGCQHFYAISSAAGGSPGTPGDVVFSIDKGLNWFAHDIDGLDPAENPSAIAKVGEYIVVVSNDSGSHWAALESELISLTDPVFNEVTTGYVVGGEPNDIWSVGNKAFIVGDFGYIYTTTDPNTSVTVIDAGAATSAVLNAVHAISEEFAVAVGNDGAVVKIESDLATQMPVSPVGIGTDLQTIWVKNEDEWLAGDSAGGFWYTVDGGGSWAARALPGTAPSEISDITMPTNSIVYVSGVVDSHGRLYSSVDGGRSFTIEDRKTHLVPTGDEFTAIASCSDDPDFLLAVGLADDGADGFIVIGSD